jgi:hypothetical protein
MATTPFKHEGIEPLQEIKQNKLRVLSRERTIETERPPIVGEVNANFCG